MGTVGNIIRKIVGIGSKKPEETLVGAILTKNLPNKAEVQKIMLEIEQEYKSHEHEYEMGFLDVVKDAQKLYEHEPLFSKLLKSSARWVIAIEYTNFYIFFRIMGSIQTNSWALLQQDFYLIGGLWAFLFVSRGFEKIFGKA